MKKNKFGSKVLLSTILATSLITSGPIASLNIFTSNVEAKSISTTPLTPITWDTTVSFPSQTGAGYVQAQNGKIYLFGGFTTTNYTYLKKSVEIDPVTKTVTPLPDLPTSIGYSGVEAIAANDGFIYLFGGSNSADATLGTRYNTTVYKFNPNTYTYTSVGPLGISLATGINAIQAENGKIFLISAGYSSAIYEYDITTYTTKQVATFAEGKSGAAVILNPDDGNIYVLGGCVDYTGTNTDKIYKFNPNTYEVSSAGVLPAKIRGMGSYFNNGKIYLAGGWSSELSYTTDIWEYDPITYNILPVGTLPAEMEGQTFTSMILRAMDDSLYFYRNDSFSTTTNIYKMNLENLYITYETSNVTSESVNLSWSFKGTEDVTYELTRNGELIYSGSELNFKDTNLNPGTNYVYKLTVKSGNNIIISSDRSIQTLLNPPSEAIVKNITDNSLDVVWDSNNNPPDTSYLVELTTTKSIMATTMLQDNFDDISNITKTSNWVKSSAQKSEGTYSLKSPTIADARSTTETFTFTIPSGVTNAKLSFDSMSSSEPNYDIFTATLNGSEIVKKSGLNAFTNYSQALTAGTSYTLIFKYAKDSSSARNDDAAYVDNLMVSYYGSRNTFTGTVKGNSFHFDGVDTTEGLVVTITAKLDSLVSTPVIATEEVSELVDATNKVKIVEDFVATGLEDSEKIEEAETKYQEALDAVNALPDSEEKTTLQERLEIVQEDIKEGQLTLDVIELEQLVIDEIQNKDVLNDIKEQLIDTSNAVDTLIDIDVKNALKDRLENVNNQILISEAKIETSTIEEMVKDLSSQTLIDEALSQVDITQNAINALEDSEIKTSLQDRLNDCIELINLAKEAIDNTGGNNGSGGGTDNGGVDNGSGGGTDNGGTDNGSGGGTDNGGVDNGSGGGTDNGGTDNGSGGGTDNGGVDNGSGGGTDNGGVDNGSGGGTDNGGTDNGSGGGTDNGGVDNGSGGGTDNGGSDNSSNSGTGNNNNGSSGSNNSNSGTIGDNNETIIGVIVDNGSENETNGNTIEDNNESINENYTSPFVDIQNHWCESCINKMYSLNIVEGINEKEFAPDKEITRSEFATLVVRALNLKIENSEQIFTDVSSNAWYYDYVNTAYKNNMVLGIGNNKFNPNGVVTREEMATILARILEQHADINNIDTDLNTIKEFSDYDSISEWAKYGSSLIVKTNVIQGVDEKVFAPKLEGTRAEALMMICRILDLLK